MSAVKKQTTNTLAVASAVLGVLSLIGLTVFAGIPAIVTGIMALNRSDNKSLAVVGIVLGSISVVVAIVLVMIAVLLFGLLFSLPYSDVPLNGLPSGDGSSLDSYQQRA